MTFGLQKEEIESLVTKAIEEGWRRHPLGSGLESAQPVQVRLAIAEVITQNNARILEDLAEAGIHLKKN